MGKDSPVGVAFVGCGNISSRYGEQIQEYPDHLKLVGAFDIIPERTQAFADKFGCRAYSSLADVLADGEVEIGLNITTHTAHAEVTEALLRGGKHVHSEKPLATTRAGGQACLVAAEETGLLLSCSPIAILGESQQTLRRLLAEGSIGDVHDIYAEMNHGRIETWHPDPEAFYGFGAGPLLDVGCYPLSVLIQLFGSITRVQAIGGVRLAQRTIGSGPKEGQTYQATNPDHMTVLAQFASGPLLRLTTTFFVVKSAQAGIEFHGTDGSLWTQSATAFNSVLRVCHPVEKEWAEIAPDTEPYQGFDYARGLAELGGAVRSGRKLTCPGEAAFHVLDVCLSAMEAAETGQAVSVISEFEGPH
ncbi:MAG: Gfo/Idh/MocA family oxidoreductase [Lentisphaerae bacterium]|jgi:predicted dehydrogenase|nr:Gfo/Idh/MocA family oxidoreductase [Lentisphaerota bacterium]MBT5610835.1 Gfo/Idh/MocA family oxidoreductase [Lentisphaerota bacterium]MBT7053733.1 Gfo/Idh/MocA family oxidoreductase [Lentisphaerota bacterium]MBT7841194.1 Gfo/Idh/MocA family oxidoreductase [Lentisphaerota bacterium]